MRCGAQLPAGITADFCPKCLLGAAMSTVEMEPQTRSAESVPGSHESELPAGQVFGHYRIIRLLGRGGMGAAYEAEDLDNSRRVALKILSHKLDSPESRQRFFREGRLAASVNHPNSVYIFGTEEIGGTPVIAMELLSGGTLHSRVLQRGPMPHVEAVDAVLQILEGLEAAQNAGILHRDVKPSNCFVDVNGTVKIGDFGLSISTAVRTEPALTADGSFLGTPGFCPPEQIRGEELNSQSDIYSVGATLFYLLTGRTPFEAHNTVALIATVLEKPSPSPRELRRSIPEGLSRVIQRCMHKVRGERFRNYAELRHALEQYSSAAPVPAGLGIRFLAGFADFMLLNLLVHASAVVTFGGFASLIETISNPGPRVLLFVFTSMLMGVAYYGVLEGRFGAAAGKFVCRLRVVGANKAPPGIWRACARAAVYMLLPFLPFWTICAVLYPGSVSDLISRPGTALVWAVERPWFNLLSLTAYAMMVMLFVTARRRNGYRALHDFLTNTRVVSASTLPARSQAFTAKQPRLLASGSSTQVGPYRLIETIAETPGSRWLLCYDTRLLRKVWVHQLEPGAEPFPLHLRNVGRPGRLRWLTGRRSSTEAWDAFEAADGQSFHTITASPQPWEQVRLWLDELAMEIAAARRDHTEPSLLSPDRIWITEQGKIKLLDFPAPGVTVRAASCATPGEFLSVVAGMALSGGRHRSAENVPHPMPLHARRFLSELAGLQDPNAVVLKLAPLLRLPTRVSGYRRAAIVCGCVAFPLFVAVMGKIGNEVMEQFERLHPDLLPVHQLLSMREGIRWGKAASQVSDEDFAIVVASRYRNLITNRTEWNSPLASILIKGEARRFAEQSITNYPNLTPEQIKRAASILKLPSLSDIKKRLGMGTLLQILFYSTLLIYVCFPALLCAIILKGGPVQRLAKVTYVRKDGAPASRLRVFWRALVAWGPVAVLAVTGITIASFAAPTLTPSAHDAMIVSTTLSSAFMNIPWPPIASGFLLLALTVISLVLPERSLQDRMAGTWPVIK